MSTTFAQNDSIQDPYKKKNEFKVNAISLILGAVDLTYERLLNDESAIGINAFIRYDDEVFNNVEYYVSPYYRLYFGKKYAAGFFVEGFGMLNSSRKDFEIFFENENNDFVTDFALGIGLGGKWITKSGFVGEINYGLGRNLFNTEETDFDFVAKAGISLGYRF